MLNVALKGIYSPPKVRNKSLCFESVYAYMIIEVGMPDESKAVIAFNKMPCCWEKLKAGGEGDNGG